MGRSTLEEINLRLSFSNHISEQCLLALLGLVWNNWFEDHRLKIEVAVKLSGSTMLGIRVVHCKHANHQKTTDPYVMQHINIS